MKLRKERIALNGKKRKQENDGGKEGDERKERLNKDEIAFSRREETKGR